MGYHGGKCVNWCESGILRNLEESRKNQSQESRNCKNGRKCRKCVNWDSLSSDFDSPKGSVGNHGNPVNIPEVWKYPRKVEKSLETGGIPRTERNPQRIKVRTAGTAESDVYARTARTCTLANRVLNLPKNIPGRYQSGKSSLPGRNHHFLVEESSLSWGIMTSLISGILTYILPKDSPKECKLVLSGISDSSDSSGHPHLHSPKETPESTKSDGIPQKVPKVEKSREGATSGILTYVLPKKSQH